MSAHGTKKSMRPPAALSNEARSERQARVRRQAYDDQLLSLEGFAKVGLDGLPPDERKSAIESIGGNFIATQAGIEAEDMKARRQAEEAQEEADRKAAEKKLKVDLEGQNQANEEKAAEHEQDMRDRDLAREQSRKKGELEYQWERLRMVAVIIGMVLTAVLFVVGLFGGYPTVVAGSAVTAFLSLLSPLLSRLKSPGSRRKNA